MVGNIGFLLGVERASWCRGKSARVSHQVGETDQRTLRMSITPQTATIDSLPYSNPSILPASLSTLLSSSSFRGSQGAEQESENYTSQRSDQGSVPVIVQAPSGSQPTVATAAAVTEPEAVHGSQEQDPAGDHHSTVPVAVPATYIAAPRTRAPAVEQSFRLTTETLPRSADILEQLYAEGELYQSPKPILDKMTVVCRVTKDGERVSPVELFRILYQRSTQEVTAEGEVVAEGGKREIVDPATGAKIQLWVNDNRLMATCNPTRLVYGSAAFCSSSLQVVLCKALRIIESNLNAEGYCIVPSHLSQFHLAHMFDAGDCTTAHRMLEGLKAVAKLGCQDVTTEGSGIYFAKHSKRLSVKIYRDPQKSVNGVVNPQYMGRMLRIEVVYRNQMQSFGDSTKSWFEDFLTRDLQALFCETVGRINCYSSRVVLDTVPAELTNTELGMWTRWRNHCLTEDRRAIRRSRDKIMAKTGVDIFVPFCNHSSIFETGPSFNNLLAHGCVTNLDHSVGMVSTSANDSVDLRSEGVEL